ncbi:TPA: hypothetical protein ACGW5B_005832 [Bacillus paranthracis]
MPEFLLGSVTGGKPLFDIAGILKDFVADYGATVAQALPIILGACLLVVGAMKVIGLVKKFASKLG